MTGTFRFLSGANQHRASISHTNPMIKSLALHVSFLFLETVGLLDSRALYTIEYNIEQYDTAQHNTIHYTICVLRNVSSRRVKTVLKIERYVQRLTRGYMGDGGSM